MLIDIAAEHQIYLGFSWLFQIGIRRYFTLSVLPFDLSTACFFTKLLHHLVKR